VLTPGLIRTEFHEVAGRDPTKTPFGMMEPDEVVAASLRGLEAGEVVSAPGLEDGSLIESCNEAQRTVFRTAIAGGVATRYRE
jgi:short-subunit dehydrogenase